MTTLYKLTTQDCKTRKREYNECTWGPGVTHSGTGKGELCGPGYVHAYTSALLAVLLNPIRASIQSPRLWECSGQIAKSDNGLKVGCVSLTTTGELSLPNVSTEQRVRFAILCAKAVNTDPQWNLWADNWLSGKDQTQAASYAARAASYAASRAASNAASNAARAASEAARAASEAASSAASYAAASWMASWVARYAASGSFDLIAIAEQACRGVD